MPVQRDISELAQTYHNLVNEVARENMPTLVSLEVFDASMHQETGWVLCYLADRVVRCIVDPLYDLSEAVSSVNYVLWALPAKGSDDGGEYIAIAHAMNGPAGTRTPAIRATSVTIVDSGGNSAPITINEDGTVNITNLITNNTYVDAEAIAILNSSGATANVGDIGYIDAYGDYKTTTTQADASVRWCVVVIGGADASEIYVADRGIAVVNYTGSAPSDEDFLVTSTVAGSALAQSYCSPAVFARCIGAGSGGTVQVRLLTQRQIQRVNSTEDLCRISAGSGSNFTGTINGTPSGATLVYTITGGTNEDNITPASAGELAKIVLHNTTRGDSVLIDSVDTGTNTITATANIPGTWADTDVITTRSQTNTDTISSMYFTDYDLSSADNDKISRLAVFITGFFSMSDVGAAAAYYHPYETGATSKRYAISSTAGARLMAEIPIVNNKFCVTNNASGTGTCLWLIRPISCVVAAP